MNFKKMLNNNKIPVAAVAGMLIVCIVVCAISVNIHKQKGVEPASSNTTSTTNSESLSENSESSSTESGKPASSNSSTGSKSTTSKQTTSQSKVVVPAAKQKYNTNLNIEDNVFMDSLIYTGYNMKKMRSDGNMWVYILRARKPALGYLSKISYGGGCTGYETTKEGLPDIKRFERGGLVCASYVTYVYFNYLPNVAGIDTSSLTKPEVSHLAHDWYQAVKDWVKKGWSKSVPFEATSKPHVLTKFKEKGEMPIGSVIIFRECSQTKSDHGSHVVVYAGYKNNQHWVYHVGNVNGPEMCTIERMSCGVDPQAPLYVVTPPKNIRFAARAEVTVKDQNGNPVAGAAISLKNSAGKTISLGTTNASGKVAKDNLSYGKYQLVQTVPAGYTCNEASKSVELVPQNNSLNTFEFINNK